MRLSKGFIPVRRDFFEQYFKKAGLAYYVYTWLVMNASYEKSTVWEDSKKRIHLNPGDVLTTQVEICRWTGIHKSTLKKILDDLSNKGLVEIITRIPLVLRVTKWREMNNEWMLKEKDKNSPAEQTEKPPSKEKGSYSKNQKQPEPEKSPIEMVVKNKAPAMRKNPAPDADISLGTQWYMWARKKTPATAFSLDGFINAITLIRKTRKLDDEKMIALFEFVKNDNFWQDNFISPIKYNVRSKNNDLPRIDNVLRSMARSPLRQVNTLGF